MARIIPFKAVRPAPDKAGLVASRSLEEYTLEELKFRLDNNPYSFLHIVKPSYPFRTEISGDISFELVRNRYQEFKDQGVFFRDTVPCYYIYKIRSGEHSYCGIIAATSIKDYEENVIRKHEDTIELREKLFKEYLQVAGFNTEPVLLTYPDDPVILGIMEETMAQKPEYEFTSFNKDSHDMWKVDDPVSVEKIRTAFERMPALYIADGHHRSASSRLLARESRAANPTHTGEEPYNYFLSFLIAESNLLLYEYNRMVTDLNGLSHADFLIRLDECFRIENHGREPYRPSEKHHFSMYLDGEFYSLYLREEKYEFTDSLSALDPYILYLKILKPILGIEDLRNDQRIAYIPGKNKSLEVKEAIDKGEFAVGFGMLPLTVQELKQVADEGLTMPPKSTYIEPKLRSGLTIYEF